MFHSKRKPYENIITFEIMVFISICWLVKYQLTEPATHSINIPFIIKSNVHGIYKFSNPSNH